MSQIPQPAFAPGDRVIVRGDRWRIDEVQAFSGCTLLQLSGTGEANRGTGCALLCPFDRPRLLPGDRRIRCVTRRRWVRALRAIVALATPLDQLRAAAFADLDLYPYQLEPALAAARGRSSRFLLADEVGLGKTVQAGLILAELRERGWADRALVLTPSGLRDQWAEELARRFDIHATIMDASTLHRRRATLPAGINPWAGETVSIASIDLVKRPETLQALASFIWDVLIIDEAHLVATAPQRASAVRALSDRARRLVLLTATPHAGDERAFASLCHIGRLSAEDPILLFRRTRTDVGLPAGRRVRLLSVRLTLDELRMHALLGAYVARVWREAGARNARLAAIVLTKRALSSASSLARSIERRLEMLPLGSEPAAQLALPLRPDEEELDDADAEPVLAIPGLEDAAHERACLTEILHAARRASTSERKLLALCRLLRRAREPVIVFTEYRDTLAHAARAIEGPQRVALLHGGLDAGERRAALDAFTQGHADLLFATDTGGEGLNLHARCRLVVNLELPWNPMRLEQRIGRVDRIGQSRTVHAVHLLARDTAEAGVLARLYRRVERARTALGHLRDPISSMSEHAIADAVIGGSPLEPIPNAEPAAPPSAGDTPGPLTTAPDLRPLAEADARRLLWIRRTIPGVLQRREWRRTTASALANLDRAGVLVALVPLRKFRRSPAFGTGPSLVWIFRARIVESTGRLLEEIVVPVRLPVARHPLVRSRDATALAEQLWSRLGSALTSRAQEAASDRLGEIARLHGQALQLETAREQTIAATFGADRPVLVQPGLFDTREVDDHDRQRATRRAARAEVEFRAAALEAARLIQVARPPELALVLVIQDRSV